MATYSNILAWKIPDTDEPGRLQSMGLQRVEHDRAMKHACMHAPQNVTVFGDKFFLGVS